MCGDPNVKALSFMCYGGPEVLRVINIPKPVPRENQVLVKVKALSLNDWDLGLVLGKPYINRTMAGNFRNRQFPRPLKAIR
jgi:NADPH:quinone reductase-like Zn-dependent oxidoreductase